MYSSKINNTSMMNTSMLVTRKQNRTKKTNKNTQKNLEKHPQPPPPTDSSGNNLHSPEINPQNGNFSAGNNWTGNNVATLLSWLTNANYNIECLDLSIEDCSKTIRHNVILGLMMSTGAGTISAANLGIVSKPEIKFIINVVFTVMSFIIAINTGRIKVYQIQERLEQFIKLKQEWTYFITTIAVEFQTPVILRKDALQLILNNKEKYLDLMKRDCEFTEAAKREMTKKIQQDTDQWFHLNNEFYNSHVSLLNFSKGIRINDLVDSMSYFEGMNLIEAEKTDGYDPNTNIAPFYDKVNKYDIIRHFYEVDMEDTRKANIWDIINKRLFPRYYKEMKQKKLEEMWRKRKERIRLEMEEEERRLNQEMLRYSVEEIVSSAASSDDIPEEKDASPQSRDIENQHPTDNATDNASEESNAVRNNGWFGFFHT